MKRKEMHKGRSKRNGRATSPNVNSFNPRTGKQHFANKLANAHRIALLVDLKGERCTRSPIGNNTEPEEIAPMIFTFALLPNLCNQTAPSEHIPPLGCRDSAFSQKSERRATAKCWKGNCKIRHRRKRTAPLQHPAATSEFFSALPNLTWPR